MAPTRSLIFAVGAAVLATAFPGNAAEAAPRGWQCSYANTPLNANTTTVYYYCTNKSLSHAKARARVQCGKLDFCVTGSCIPLKYTPRSVCKRE